MKNHWTIIKEPESESLPQNIVSPVDGAEMVLVPEGYFTAGTSEKDFINICLLEESFNPVFATEVPDRKVYLESYYIDRYPVTNYQYRKFIEETGHREPLLWYHPEWNQPMQPVVFIGWEDARAYARWAGKILPSEEQWEKAARGTDGRFWSWGSEFFPDRCNSREADIAGTSEIGRFDEGMSPYGCYDMCGNVWEICEGEWVDSLLPMRGGCFLGSATFVRVSCRWTPEDTVSGAHWLGFRCVKEISP